MSDLVRLSLSIEKHLFDQFEQLVAASDYGNRSEFVRDLIRNCLVDRQWHSDEEQLGVLLMVFDHHARGLTERLTGVQHDFSGTIYATTHVHLDHHLCAEMIMVRGLADDIQSLLNNLRREKGVLFANLASGTTGELFSNHGHDHRHAHNAHSHP